MTDTAVLFAALRSRPSLTLPNRVVMAPMTRSFSPAACPTESGRLLPPPRRGRGRADHLRGHGVDRPASLNDPNIPRFHGERELAGWKRVIDEVHAAGGMMAPQLWHVGAARRRTGGAAGPFDSPSGLVPGKRSASR